MELQQWTSKRILLLFQDKLNLGHSHTSRLVLKAFLLFLQMYLELSHSTHSKNKLELQLHGMKAIQNSISMNRDVITFQAFFTVKHLSVALLAGVPVVFYSIEHHMPLNMFAFLISSRRV